MDPLTAERIAANNARFREANEHIRRAAETYEVDSKVPFLCECPDPGCMEIVRLDLDEYREVRKSPRWFLKAPSHGPDAGPAARIVSTKATHLIVEKVGRAGDVAEALAREGRGEE